MDLRKLRNKSFAITLLMNSQLKVEDKQCSSKKYQGGSEKGKRKLFIPHRPLEVLKTDDRKALAISILYFLYVVSIYSFHLQTFGIRVASNIIEYNS